MTEKEKIFLTRIQNYANEVLGDIDPQKVQVSVQLEKLKPIMETLAAEENQSLEDIFIKYMDLSTEFSVENEKKFQNDLGNPGSSDVYDFKL